MSAQKKQLIKISQKVFDNKKLSPQEVEKLLSFERKDDDNRLVVLLKQSALPLAIVVGFLLALSPENTQQFATHLPSWTNLPEPIHNGLNYIWNIISDPVEGSNIMYHLPNIILYSFGFLGVKKLFDALERRTWVDKVLNSKTSLQEKIQTGTLPLSLAAHHSVLFAGNGDFIAAQFVADNNKDAAVTVATQKPSYTTMWNYYNPESSYEDLELVVKRTCDKNTGEYIFFPVKDDQIFLPSVSAYDLSPHKLDILCQDLRSIEKKFKWSPKRILIVGDRFHTSFVQSEDKKGKIKKSEDIISLDTISKKYKNVSIIDPTDIVLNHIKTIAKGRKIVFRATKEGIKEYKQRFFERLAILKYKELPSKKGVLTIGYDLLEDQTEQQTLSRKINDYYPVVLSKAVRDALIRNGYKSDEFIYVPELVLAYLKSEAMKQ